MTTYYIDPTNGLDVNAGTSLALPKKQFSALSLSSGDTVLIIPNADDSPHLIVQNTQYATIGVTNIKISSSSSKRPKISFKTTSAAKANPVNGFRGNGSSAGWSVSNIDFVDCFNFTCVTFSDVSGSISDCSFTKIWGGLGAASVAAFSHGNSGASSFTSTATNVQVYDCEGDGLIYNVQTIANTTDIRISNCKVIGASTNDGAVGDCIQIAGVPKYVLVEDCVLDHSSNSIKQCFIQSNTSDTLVPGSLVHLRRNTIIGYQASEYNALDSGWFKAVYSSQICIFESNYISSGQFGVIANGGRVSGNVFICSGVGPNDSNNVGTLHSYNQGVVCTNNLFVRLSNQGALDPWPAMLKIIGGGSGGLLKNNIFIGCGIAVIAPNTVLDSNNLYYNVLTPMKTEVLGARTAVASMTSDPLLNLSNPLKPKISRNSPCRSAGTSVGYYTDFRGRSFNNPPSIGPFEFTSRSKR